LALPSSSREAGRPDTWISARWNEFSNVHPTLTADVSHFGTGFSNRHDYWRVAWTTFKSHPVAGVGSGRVFRALVSLTLARRERE